MKYYYTFSESNYCFILFVVYGIADIWSKMQKSKFRVPEFFCRAKKYLIGRAPSMYIYCLTIREQICVLIFAAKK